MKKIFIALALVTIFLGGCIVANFNRIEGNGNIANKEFDLPAFEKIDAGGAIHVKLKQGSQSVVLNTDDNLFEYITAKVENGTLRLYTRDGNLNPTDKIAFYITMPKLSKLTLSGASFAITDAAMSSNEEVSLNLSGASHAQIEISTPTLKANLSGASNLETRGRSQQLDLNASGASHYKGFNAVSTNASIDLSGASKAQINVENSLDVQASGGSGVQYKGQPKIKQQVSGAASVSAAN